MLVVVRVIKAESTPREYEKMKGQEEENEYSTKKESGDRSIWRNHFMQRVYSRSESFTSKITLSESTRRKEQKMNM